MGRGRITGQLSIDDLRAILDADDAVEPASPETAACDSASDVYWVEGTGFPNASSVGQNTLVTGGTNNFDLSLFKTVVIDESSRLEFRWRL
jgi:hypothetical protein